MVFAPHMRVTALGRLGTTPERFSYGVNMAVPESTSPLGIDFTASAGVFADLAEDVRAFHSDAALSLSNQAILETVKFALIGPDGKYTADPYIVDVTDTPGASASIPAPQLALAVSLTSARRGPSGKGRFYLPMPGANLTSGDLRWADAYRDTAQASAAVFLNNLNNAPGIDVLNLQVVISSTKGFNTVVTGCRVGRVADTIRSRRRSLDEAYDPPTAVS